MDRFARLFLEASLACFGLGVTRGLAMAAYPPLAAYRTAHLHVNLLGFVAIMIFGVAYHVIPRFTGHPLHSRTMAGVHWWASNVGLLLLAGGFALRVGGGRIPVHLQSLAHDRRRVAARGGVAAHGIAADRDLARAACDDVH